MPKLGRGRVRRTSPAFSEIASRRTAASETPRRRASLSSTEKSSSSAVTVVLRVMHQMLAPYGCSCNEVGGARDDALTAPRRVPRVLVVRGSALAVPTNDGSVNASRPVLRRQPRSSTRTTSRPSRDSDVPTWTRRTSPSATGTSRVSCAFHTGLAQPRKVGSPRDRRARPGRHAPRGRAASSRRGRRRACRRFRGGASTTPTSPRGGMATARLAGPSAPPCRSSGRRGGSVSGRAPRACRAASSRAVSCPSSLVGFPQAVVSRQRSANRVPCTSARTRSSVAALHHEERRR